MTTESCKALATRTQADVAVALEDMRDDLCRCRANPSCKLRNLSQGRHMIGVRTSRRALARAGTMIHAEGTGIQASDPSPRGPLRQVPSIVRSPMTKLQASRAFEFEQASTASGGGPCERRPCSASVGVGFESPLGAVEGGSRASAVAVLGTAQTHQIPSETPLFRILCWLRVGVSWDDMEPGQSVSDVSLSRAANCAGTGGRAADPARMAQLAPTPSPTMVRFVGAGLKLRSRVTDASLGLMCPHLAMGDEAGRELGELDDVAGGLLGREAANEKNDLWSGRGVRSGACRVGVPR